MEIQKDVFVSLCYITYILLARLKFRAISLSLSLSVCVCVCVYVFLFLLLLLFYLPIPLFFLFLLRSPDWRVESVVQNTLALVL